MKTIVIEIKDDKALPLLEQMKKENLIGMDAKAEAQKADTKLSARFRGKLSAASAEKLHEHVTESREGWNRNI